MVRQELSAAVSVRSRCVPRLTGSKPACRAACTSAGLKSPSGPMRIQTSRWRAHLCCSSILSASSMQWAINNCALPPVCAPVKSVKLRGVSKRGSHRESDCFMAERAIFSSRSMRRFLRSERSHHIGVKESKPISTAFSMSHSVRSAFLVGAIASCSRQERSNGVFFSFSMWSVQPFLFNSTIRPSRSAPCPSVQCTTSPTLWRSTCAQCRASSSSRKAICPRISWV